MSEDPTRFVKLARQGDELAARQLIPQLYQELRGLAHHYVARARGNRPGLLQPTALVHEAFLRLVDQSKVELNSRTHFFAFAAATMRNVLVDGARAELAAKRGVNWRRVTLEHAAVSEPQRGVDLLALDDALNKLALLSQRAARIVELRFFGGLTVQEAGRELGVSERTVKDDWRMARAWLRVHLAEANAI